MLQVSKARILLVDDHPVVRQGVAMLINREADLQACCEAAAVDEALKANRVCRHDLAIVDLSLGNMSGLDLVKRLTSEFPELRILVMSMHDETVYAELALRAGAHGYLMKQAATDIILQAARQVLRGEIFASNEVTTRMLKKISGNSEANSPISGLSPAEAEVLHLIGLGLSTVEIAGRLSRSVKTIESHRANIKKKFNLGSSNQLNHFAINVVLSNNHSSKTDTA